MNQPNRYKIDEMESEEEKLRLLSTEKFGFILSLKNSFAFVQSFFEDEQFFLHANEFYPDIAVNDTVAFHFMEVPKGKQVNRIRKLDISSSVKILEDIKGIVVRSNDNRVKYNNVGLVKLEKSSLDHSKEYQQYFENKFDNNLIFSTSFDGSNRRMVFGKDKKLSFSISQINSSHLFIIKENIKEMKSDICLSSSPVNNNISKEHEFNDNVKNMLQTGMKKEYGIVSLLKNKEYGFIRCENFSEEIYFQLTDFYYSDFSLVKINMEVEFFVISEIHKGSMSNRAMYLKLVPNNTAEFEVRIAEKVKLMILSSSFQSPDQGELEIPLSIKQIPLDLQQEESFPVNLFQPCLKNINIWPNSLPNNKFICRKGDEFLIDIVYHKPKKCFVAKNFELIKYSPLDRDFGIVISSTKFNVENNYKGDNKSERENNKIIIFSLTKFLMLQSRETKIYTNNYQELNLIPHTYINGPTNNYPQEIIEEIKNPQDEFLLKDGSFVSFDTIYFENKVLKSVRLKVCTIDEIKNEKDKMNSFLLENLKESESYDELFTNFYNFTSEKIVEVKDEKKKSKNALLKDLKNIMIHNNSDSKTLEENLTQYFLMKSFLISPKYLIDKDLKGNIVKKVKSCGNSSNNDKNEKKFEPSDKIILKMIQQSPPLSPISPSTSSPLTYKNFYGSLTPVSLSSKLSSILSISSLSLTEEIGQIEIQPNKNRIFANFSNYIFYNKSYYNNLLFFLFSKKYSNLKTFSLDLVPSFIIKQYEIIIDLFFSSNLVISVKDNIYYNGTSYKSVRIVKKNSSEEDKLNFYTKENFHSISSYIKSVKTMIKNNNTCESNINESSIVNVNNKKTNLNKKKLSDNLIIPYHNSDYLTDLLYGPLDNGHEIFFNAYYDPIKNKVMAKEIIMTDEPILDIDSNVNYIGVLEIIMNKPKSHLSSQSNVFFNGFIRHIETDEKFYWNNYHFSSSTSLKDLKNNSLVSFQVRKRGGLRSAININNVSSSIKNQIEKKKDEILDVECNCLMINSNYAIILDIVTGSSIDSRYLNYSNFSKILGESLFLNELGDWKKNNNRLNEIQKFDAQASSKSVLPDVNIEFKPNYYNPLGREPILVTFNSADQPKLKAGNIIKAKLVINLYKSRSIIGLIFSSISTEIKSIKKKGKVLRTNVTLKNLIEFKGSQSSPRSECVLPSSVYSSQNIRYNYPSLEMIEIQDFDEISTTDRAKLLGDFHSPPYSYYFCFFSDAFILKDVENFIVDVEASPSSIYIGDCMHYYIIPELYGNLALFPYFETFHDLKPTKLAFSKTTQGLSNLKLGKKSHKPVESKFVPAIYAEGPPTEFAVGFPLGWMPLNMGDISNRSWCHLLNHLK